MAKRKNSRKEKKKPKKDNVLIVDMYKYSMDTHTDNNIKVE